MIKSMMTAVFGTRFDRERKRLQPVVDRIHAAEERLKDLSETELKAQTSQFRDRLAESTGAVKTELEPRITRPGRVPVSVPFSCTTSPCTRVAT
jgi:preprotein translocase subunit SecA